MEPDRPGLDELLAPLRDPRYRLDPSGADSAGIGSAHGHHPPVSVRRTEHAGHEIQIETTYRVFIDGQEFPDPISVTDDGRVHYHGLPQYSMSSALELLKVIVDNLAEEELPPPVGGGA